MDRVIARLAELKLIPVLRATSREIGIEASKWLIEAGCGTVEMTLTTPQAAEVIATLRRAHPAALIGAGTVLSVHDADAVLDAGAQYVVTPCFVEGVGERCAAAGVPLLMGAMTPGEILRARLAGAAAVKVFPAREAGGPAFLRAVRAVFPDIPLIPTGGISPAGARAYLDAGAIAVGLGSELAPRTALEAGDRDTVAAAVQSAQQVIFGDD